MQLRCLHGVWSRVGDSHGKLKNDFGASGFFAAGGAAQGKSTQHQCSACTLLLTACSLQMPRRPQRAHNGQANLGSGV